MTTKYTQQDVADALTVFIKSGSASGNEAMRRYCINHVELFAEADRLRSDNTALVAALQEIDDSLSGSLPVTAEVKEIARAALTKYNEVK